MSVQGFGAVRAFVPTPRGPGRDRLLTHRPGGRADVVGFANAGVSAGRKLDFLIIAALSIGQRIGQYGWTPERIATFLGVLADTGIVAEGYRAAGMSKNSAYALRNRDPVFAAAWRAGRRGRARRAPAVRRPGSARRPRRRHPSIPSRSR